MQYLTIAVALSGLLVPSLAAPAAKSYHWSVTKWQFGRGDSAYDYSFNVAGPQNGKVPGFTATCSGTQKGDYKACTVTSAVGKLTPFISANVNIVTDPNDPNDTIPRVFVQEIYTDNQGCRYTYTGHHDATLNEGSTTGTKFPVIPGEVTGVC